MDSFKQRSSKGASLASVETGDGAGAEHSQYQSQSRVVYAVQLP